MSTKSENVADDWECIDDSELNTTVDELKKSATSSQQNNTPVTEDACCRSLAAMIMNDDDSMRSYCPAAPTVKILKRPTNDRRNPSAAELKPKAPIKTLQQREQEYAEARLRILGSAKSTDEENEQSAPPQATVVNNKHTNGYTNRNVNNAPNPSRQYSRNSMPQQQPFPAQQFHQHHPNLLHQQQYLQQQQPQALVYPIPADSRRLDENVIRLPRGPDGPGFMLKR